MKILIQFSMKTLFQGFNIFKHDSQLIGIWNYTHSKRIVLFSFICLLLASTGRIEIIAQSTIPYRWKNVEIMGGGFVDGVIFSPATSNLIYARTDVGGAYRWNPDSNRWIPITDMFNRTESTYQGIESIAPDPVDSNIVYMAVGMYVSAGNGLILKSTNRGDTWTRYTIGVPMGGNNDGRSMGERLAIDPNNDSILYFGSRRSGLRYSKNAGVSWSKVSSFPVNGNTDLGLSFVLFDKFSGNPGNGSSIIYVGVASTVAGSNLYCSSDTGKTWNLVLNGPTGLMPHHAVMASDSTIYLAYNNGPGPNSISHGEVWKYKTTSGEWTQISPPSGGGGFGGISVDASDPDAAVVSTIDWWSPDDIYRTTNGGDTWTTIGVGSIHDKNGAEYLCWGPPGCNTAGSGWMGDIEIDPFNSNRAMYVTGQGIWGSDNINAPSLSQVKWTFINKGLEETVVLDMTSSVRGAFFSAVGDLGGMRHTNLDQAPATGMYLNPIFGNTEGIDFAAGNPQIVARVGNSNSLGAYSTNNGITWRPFTTRPSGATTGGSVAVSANGQTIVWAPSGSTAAYTNDYGNTWTDCGGLDNGLEVVSDRVDPEKFYAYSNGQIYVSTDAGATFTAKATVENRPGSRARAVFGISGEVWVCNDYGGLYRSDDAGITASKIANIQRANALGFGKAAQGKVYPSIYLVGTVNNIYGFYRSTDEGVTWDRINDDQHQYGWIDHAAGDEIVFGRMYIGTGGRGILYGEPEYDCNGVLNGTAYYDLCDSCVGGNTGKEPCPDFYDCNWVINGMADPDSCGKCTGGNTENESCIEDCNGVWGGSAFIDSCDICVRGNTGLKPCVISSIESDENNIFSYSPNPFTGSLHLQTTVLSEYKVANISGVLLESGHCKGDMYIGANLQPGIHIMTIRTQNGIKMIKIIKQ